VSNPDRCRQCGLPTDSEEYRRLALKRFCQPMCTACYATSVKKGYAAQAKYCGVCKNLLGISGCERCTVRERTGADVFECDCGAVVDMADSVRMMRKPTNKIERVCKDCSKQGTCRAETHSLRTPQHRDWEPARFTFTPLPDDFPVGYCHACGMQMYWDGRRWSRMTWTILADAWEKSDA
jgi:hypothetical protein